jgi:hypothetical protein
MLVGLDAVFDQHVARSTLAEHGLSPAGLRERNDDARTSYEGVSEIAIFHQLWGGVPRRSSRLPVVDNAIYKHAQFSLAMRLPQFRSRADYSNRRHNWRFAGLAKPISLCQRIRNRDRC